MKSLWKIQTISLQMELLQNDINLALLVHELCSLNLW
jgi:hypothetical protein